MSAAQLVLCVLCVTAHARLLCCAAEASCVRGSSRGGGVRAFRAAVYVCVNMCFDCVCFDCVRLSAARERLPIMSRGCMGIHHHCVWLPVPGVWAPMACSSTVWQLQCAAYSTALRCCSPAAALLLGPLVVPHIFERCCCCSCCHCGQSAHASAECQVEHVSLHAPLEMCG